MKPTTLPILLLFLLTHCTHPNTPSTNPPKTNPITKVEVYCWCFNLDYFGRLMRSSDSGSDTRTLEGLQLCYTPTNTPPSSILSHDHYKGNITDQDKNRLFAEQLLTKRKKNREQKEVDARLVFVVHYQEESTKDTLVYINDTTMWMKGAYFNYDRSVDSLLHQFCGDWIAVCPS